MERKTTLILDTRFLPAHSDPYAVYFEYAEFTLFEHYGGKLV